MDAIAEQLPISEKLIGDGFDPAGAESSNIYVVGDRNPSDHEDDTRAAMEAIRGFILLEMSQGSAAEVRMWHGLDEYIDDLCSQGLDKLSREPDTLAAEGARLRMQLENVSCSNYRALIQSFECAGAVRDGVGKIRNGLDTLVEALPLLAIATREFSTNGVLQQNQRENCLRILAEHGRVIDLLEMPKLMRSLLSEELYDDALELRDMSLKIASMHADEPILLSICSEVDALTRQMIIQLLVLLRGHVQLPACLRIIGFLRRLSMFSEQRLRAIFLQCRGDWIHTNLDTATGPNAQARLVRLSDETRSMLFEVITQYRAAFTDEGDGGPEAQVELPAGAILYDWTASFVSQYLVGMEEGLRDVRDGASLSTVMQQAMYCGQSLGRVGADFRPALVPLFEDALMKIVNFHLNAALRQFEMMIEDQRWAPVGSSALRLGRANPESQASVDQGRKEIGLQNLENGSLHSNIGNSLAENGSHDSFDPPENVLDSPALAVFMNGILAALNELRSCALMSVSTSLANRVGETMLAAADSMSSLGGPGGVFLKRTDRPHFAAMHASLRDLCVPHVARCLDHCLGQSGLIEVTRIHGKMREIFGDSGSATFIHQLGEDVNSGGSLDCNGNSAVVCCDETKSIALRNLAAPNSETVSDSDASDPTSTSTTESSRTGTLNRERGFLHEKGDAEQDSLDNSASHGNTIV
jgi:conserved oligomeric Golgi complex subunit 8